MSCRNHILQYIPRMCENTSKENYSLLECLNSDEKKFFSQMSR